MKSTFSLINGRLSFRRSRDLRTVRTLLNPYTFVDPKRESGEKEPDRSKLPDTVPEEVLKVKRRRLSTPWGGGGGEGEGGRIFSTCLLRALLLRWQTWHLSVTADTTSCFSSFLGLR